MLNEQGHEAANLVSSRPIGCTIAVVVMLVLHIWVSQSFSEQTREQCNNCCKASNTDEYYYEQCRLKCFRNNDHCSGKPSAEPARPPEPQNVQPRPRQQPPEQVYQEQPREQQPPPARPQGGRSLNLPQTLSLVPGRESESAAQLLQANGIPPQHPNFQPALKAIEGVFINFARSNPTGGRLPTSELEWILKRYR